MIVAQCLIWVHGMRPWRWYDEHSWWMEENEWDSEHKVYLSRCLCWRISWAERGWASRFSLRMGGAIPGWRLVLAEHTAFREGDAGIISPLSMFCKRMIFSRSLGVTGLKLVKGLLVEAFCSSWSSSISGTTWLGPPMHVIECLTKKENDSAI